MNKKFLLTGLVIVCLLLPAWATRHAYSPSAPAEGLGQGSALMSAQIAWQVLDATTDADAEPDDLAVDERTYLTVVAAIGTPSSVGDGEISYAKIPPTWNGIRFRCICITNNEDVEYKIYVGTLANETDCELVLLGTLTYMTGLQVSTTTDYELADKLTVTAGDWSAIAGFSSPRNDHCAEYAINLLGADLVVAVPVIVDADCKLLMKGY